MVASSYFFKAEHHFSPCFFLVVHFSAGLCFISEYFFYAFLSFDFQWEVISFINSPDR